MCVGLAQDQSSKGGLYSYEHFRWMWWDRPGVGKAEVTKTKKYLGEKSGMWIKRDYVLKKWYLNEVLKNIYAVNTVEVKLLWRIWALREVEVQRPRERKIIFSIGVSEWNNIGSLCVGVSDNEHEQAFREISWRVNFGNATEVFSFFVFKFFMITCSSVRFSDCLVWDYTKELCRQLMEECCIKLLANVRTFCLILYQLSSLKSFV